jgi:hypothetical protein
MPKIIFNVHGFDFRTKCRFSSFARAQEIFKEALSANELRLGIVKGPAIVSRDAADREEMSVDDKVL